MFAENVSGIGLFQQLSGRHSEFARATSWLSGHGSGHHVKNVPPAVACPRCGDRNCTTTFHIPNGIKFE